MDIYIAYGFSILTAVVAIVMMQFKSMTLILIGQITANLLTALSYFFVGGWSGSGICFIAIIQSVIMFFYDRKKIKPQLWVILFFIAAYVTCSAILVSSVFDIFSAAAAVCFAISIVQKNPFFSRIWYAADMLLWTVYDISCRQYGNLIMHAVIFLSTFIAMIRVDGLFRKKTNAENK